MKPQFETLREYYASIGVPTDNVNSGGWPLEDWMTHVLDKRIISFSDSDLNRALVQGEPPEIIVPEVLVRLRQDPLAGDFCDGDLGAALRHVESSFWVEHPELLHTAIECLQNISDEDYADAVKSRQRLVRIRKDLNR